LSGASANVLVKYSFDIEIPTSGVYKFETTLSTGSAVTLFLDLARIIYSPGTHSNPLINYRYYPQGVYNTVVGFWNPSDAASFTLKYGKTPITGTWT